MPVFAPALPELSVHGMIYVLGIDPYLPRVVLALGTIRIQSAMGRWSQGFHTVRGGGDKGDRGFRPQLSEL